MSGPSRNRTRRPGPTAPRSGRGGRHPRNPARAAVLSSQPVPRAPVRTSDRALGRRTPRTAATGRL